MANASQQLPVINVQLAELETSSNLTNNELTLIKQQMGESAFNFQAAALYVLIHGPTAIGSKIRVSLPAAEPIRPDVLIDQEFIKRIWSLPKSNPGLIGLKQSTPAGKMGFFDNGSDSVGITCGSNPKTQASNPVYGEETYFPPHLRQAMQRVKYDYFDETQSYINRIKTQAYLAAPKTSYASKEKIALFLDKVNALCSSLEHLLMDIYRGAIEAVRIFIAYINGLMNMLQQYINNLIEQIIPADLMCLFLQVLQFFVKDITSYTAVFSHSLSINNVGILLNQYIGQYVTQLENKDLWSYLPKDVQNILNQVQQFTTNPKAYLGSSIKNLSFNHTMQGLQSTFLTQTAKQYSNNIGYIGAYNTDFNKSLLQSIAQVVKQNNPANVYQAGTEDPILTNAYGEKIEGVVATAAYEVKNIA